MIGLSADTCNVLFGSNHSVSTLLSDEIPYLLTVKCSCHSTHLGASHATKRLPGDLENGLRAIYNHFRHSTARRRDFESFQRMQNTAKHKILSPGQTRWLSLESCVWRIIEQLESLKEYFNEEIKDGKLASINLIIGVLNHNLTVPFLFFVAYAFNQLNEVNTQFQSESPQINLLKSEIHRLIKTFEQNFMTLRYVRGVGNWSFFKIDLLMTSQYLPYHQIFLGRKKNLSLDFLFNFFYRPISLVHKQIVTGKIIRNCRLKIERACL